MGKNILKIIDERVEFEKNILAKSIYSVISTDLPKDGKFGIPYLDTSIDNNKKIIKIINELVDSVNQDKIEGKLELLSDELNESNLKKDEVKEIIFGVMELIFDTFIKNTIDTIESETNKIDNSFVKNTTKF